MINKLVYSVATLFIYKAVYCLNCNGRYFFSFIFNTFLETISPIIGDIVFKILYSPIAQLVEHTAVNRDATGSSPVGRAICFHRQAVKSSPFHGEVRGSNPLGSTINFKITMWPRGSVG